MADDKAALGLAQGQVRLLPWTPEWIRLFDREAARLLAALPEADIAHCGSTSVPGLAAKPILDVLVGLPAPINVEEIQRALRPLGYEHASWAGVPGHEVFGKGQPRTQLLHVVPVKGESWDRMLRFRDALREDAKLAARYERLKAGLAARHPNDRSAYTDAKSDFIKRVLAQGR